MFRRCLFACALAAGPAAAVEIRVDGYADLRLVAPPSTESYLDGGLGKLRFGEDDNGFQPGDVVGVVSAGLAPEWSAAATARINTEYGPGIDLIEASIAYTPRAAGDWNWSVRAGAFFPPLSLENDQIGWTSFWTITPSAIDSWAGGELRVIGAEGTLQWRRASGDLTFKGAVFGWNDPAGTMIALRGWTFDDRAAGLFEHEILPGGGTTQLFTEIDGRPGWYLDLSWTPSDIGGFEVMYYDNNADPRVVKDGRVAWKTRFWDAGFEKQIGKFTLLSQGMMGSTTIAPSPFYRQATDFRAAYVLLGYDMDEWWAAARFDVFQTRTRATFPSGLSEDGHAFTLSLSWLPKSWLRFTAEVLSTDDTRREGIDRSEKPHQTETQLQLLARVYF